MSSPRPQPRFSGCLLLHLLILDNSCVGCILFYCIQLLFSQVKECVLKDSGVWMHQGQRILRIKVCIWFFSWICFWDRVSGCRASSETCYTAEMIFKSCLYLWSAEITGLVCVELESDFRTPRKALPAELVPPAEPQPPELDFQKVSILDILYQEKSGVY